MRELKFRFWNTLTGKFEEDSDLFFIRGDGVICSNDSVENNLKAEQYTGLKDKNGKEIYEGDIIQEKGLLSLTCVEWNKNNARYMTRVLEESKCVSTTFYFDVIDALGCEVIGNIHENQELLEQDNAKN